MTGQVTTSPKLKTCHVYVKKTAMEMAGAVYEEAARDNKFRKDYPSSWEFRKHYWPMYIGAARQTLAQMLGQENISEHMKEEIFDILIKDRSLQSLQGTIQGSGS